MERINWILFLLACRDTPANYKKEIKWLEIAEEMFDDGITYYSRAKNFITFTRRKNIHSE